MKGRIQMVSNSDLGIGGVMEKIQISIEQALEMRDILIRHPENSESIIENWRTAGYIKTSAIDEARSVYRGFLDAGQMSTVMVAHAAYERAYTEEHEARLAAEAKLKPILGMLFDILAAWKYESDQGDGIMEEHSKLFDAANAMLKEYKK